MIRRRCDDFHHHFPHKNPRERVFFIVNGFVINGECIDFRFVSLILFV